MLSPYSRHVEPVQKVLDAHLCLCVDGVRVFELQDALRHRLNHVLVSVSDLLQCPAKVLQSLVVSVAAFELTKVPETLSVPLLKIEKYKWLKIILYH